MKANHLFLCFVLFFSSVCFNALDAISEHAKDSLTLDTNSQNCNCENGRCVTDKQGHSKCVCKPGFSLQDEFTCKPCDCGSLGKCIFTLKLTEGDKYQYQKKCVCDVGKAEKDGVCVDCFCGENSACDFDQGERRCYCIEGYSEKDSVCTKCDCGFNGECEYENGIKKCKCDEGYLELNGVCEECDCGDHGTCLFEKGQKTCKCQPGFVVNNGKCGSCDCGPNSENCLFDGDVKRCKCKDKYADRYGTCEECYCGDHSQSCNFNENQKTCSCFEGYVQKGETCELGCSKKHQCQNGGYCIGGFCFCLNGTRGEFCDVIDECSTLCPNRKDIKCSYDITYQKAYCKCLDNSLIYNPIRKECRTGCSAKHPCQNGGLCKGGFCLCLNGTRGEFCEVIDECSTLCPNRKDIKCSYDIASQKAYCSCLDSNFRYDPKAKQCRKTCHDDGSCKNHGKCTGTSNLKFCDCLVGTTGDFCEEVSVCRGVNCGCGAYCVFNPSTKSAGCACRNPELKYDPYIGTCRFMCDSQKDCFNGGVCGQNKYCYCLAGTQGDRCQIVDNCHFGYIRCFGEAYCTFDLSIRMATCKCKNEKEVYDFGLGRCRGYCTKHADCLNGGSCGYGGYCYCLPGTQGTKCEIVDDCYFGRIQCLGGKACCAYDLRTFRGTCLC